MRSHLVCIYFGACTAQITSTFTLKIGLLYCKNIITHEYFIGIPPSLFVTTPRSADKTSNHFNSNSCGISYDLIYFPSLQWVWDAGYKSQMEIGGVPLVYMKMYNIPSWFLWWVAHLAGLWNKFCIQFSCNLPELSPSELRGWMCKV